MATSIFFVPPQPAITTDYPVAADYSAKQFFGVGISAAGVATLLTGATAKGGILINAPTASQEGAVQFFGKSKITLGATFSAGNNSFRYGSDGRAVVATTGQSAAGYVAVTASTVAGTVVDCVLMQHLAE